MGEPYSDHQKYLNFIEKYSASINAATGSEVDANANVELKTITTMEAEMFKKDAIKNNRLAMYQRIKELYDEDLAEQYIKDVGSHLIYRHDETAVIGKPYCASITMYPFILNGLKDLGGTSEAPKNLQSFLGSFVNLVFAVSAQLAGACATPEFLAYFDYYVRKEYGDDYYLHADRVVDLSTKHRTIGDIIDGSFQQVVYCLNQPAGARGYQSTFWNIQYFDKYYFKGIFEDFCFPDGTQMQWESVSWLQKRFMKWFNKERTKKILSFPVETLALLTNGDDFMDQDWADFAAEMLAEGHSFFIYQSDNVDSLSSCCRLRNEIADNQFSYTLGAGGVSTGSKCVMTINMNRLVQSVPDHDKQSILDEVRDVTKRVHMYLKAFNTILEDRYKAGLIPIYNAGYVTPDRQYLTVGINGAIESAEYLGCEITPTNNEYEEYINSVLKVIHECNVEDREQGIMFNTEFVPAESLGPHNAEWDKADGLKMNRPCYNSYFFIVEDPTYSVFDKLALHGKKFTQYLDGGSACHIALEEHLTKEQYKIVNRQAIRLGCPYWTFNIPNTKCNECGFISKHYLKACPKCGGTHLDYATRVIGYLKFVSSYSLPRQQEAAVRHYGKWTETN